MAILCYLCLIDDEIAKFLGYLIEYWLFLSVYDGLHLCSEHGVSMKGDIIETHLAGLRGETLCAQVLQEQLDADGLELLTIYHYYNELCRLVLFPDACFISGCMISTGDRVYRLFASSYFNFDQFAEWWRCGRQALCVHVLLF